MLALHLIVLLKKVLPSLLIHSNKGLTQLLTVDSNNLGCNDDTETHEDDQKVMTVKKFVAEKESVFVNLTTLKATK